MFSLIFIWLDIPKSVCVFSFWKTGFNEDKRGHGKGPLDEFCPECSWWCHGCKCWSRWPEVPGWKLENVCTWLTFFLTRLFLSMRNLWIFGLEGFLKTCADFLASFPKARFSKVFCILKFGCCWCRKCWIWSDGAASFGESEVFLLEEFTAKFSKPGI